MKALAMLGAFVVAFTLSNASGASAMTCTQRHRECLRNCDKLFPGRPACTSQCADTLPKCMSTGCWINKMANKCGYTKG
ncbi:MAG TPA: hypothetical protein VF601_12075 [Beijerinckiaceae bacterium]|jgi:hypothetical protein